MEIIDGYVSLEDGYLLASSDDGKRAKRVPVEDEPGTGWHLVTEAEYDAQCEAVIEEAARRVLAESAARN